MDLPLSLCFTHYTKRQVLHVRPKLTLPFPPSKGRKASLCLMLLWAWESSAPSCSQHHQPDCEEQHGNQQQLLCPPCCKLDSASSKSIPVTDFCLITPVSCWKAKSEMNSLARVFMDIQQASPLDRILNSH